VSEPQFVDIYALPVDQPTIARELLAAAGDQQELVRTISEGFRVPADIAAAAGYAAGDAEVVDSESVSGSALANTALSADTPVADVLSGSSPDSLPAKVDGGRANLTDRPAADTVADEDADDAAEGELKGEALDEALRSAGLPVTGKADEKRARLAEFRATQGN
jgi:hypothetical protein